jgi:hypothetical protein
MRANRGYDQGKTDVTSVSRGHDLALAAFSDAPFGGACGIDDPLKLATTRET